MHTLLARDNRTRQLVVEGGESREKFDGATWIKTLGEFSN